MRHPTDLAISFARHCQPYTGWELKIHAPGMPDNERLVYYVASRRSCTTIAMAYRTVNRGRCTFQATYTGNPAVIHDSEM